MSARSDLDSFKTLFILEFVPERTPDFLVDALPQLLGPLLLASMGSIQLSTIVSPLVFGTRTSILVFLIILKMEKFVARYSYIQRIYVQTFNRVDSNDIPRILPSLAFMTRFFSDSDYRLTLR